MMMVMMNSPHLLVPHLPLQQRLRPPFSRLALKLYLLVLERHLVAPRQPHAALLWNHNQGEKPSDLLHSSCTPPAHLRCIILRSVCRDGLLMKFTHSLPWKFYTQTHTH